MGPNLAWNKIELQLCLVECVRSLGAHITHHGKADEQWNAVNELFFGLPQNQPLRDAHYVPGNPRKLRDKWADLYKQTMIRIRSMRPEEFEKSNDGLLKLVKAMHEEKESAEFMKKETNQGPRLADTVAAILASATASTSASAATTTAAAVVDSSSSFSSSADEIVKIQKPSTGQKRNHAEIDENAATIPAEVKVPRTHKPFPSTASSSDSIAAVVPSLVIDYERGIRDRMIESLRKENKSLKDIITELEIKKDREQVTELIDEIGIKAIIMLYGTAGERFSQAYFRSQIEQLGITPLVSIKLYTWLELWRAKVLSEGEKETSPATSATVAPVSTKTNTLKTSRR